MNKVPAHMINPRGFVNANVSDDYVDELVMSARQQLDKINEQKKKIKPFITDPAYASQHQQLKMMLEKLNKQRKKLQQHIRHNSQHDHLLIKRMKVFLTDEQFNMAVGMAKADEEAIAQQIKGLYDDYCEKPAFSIREQLKGAIQ